MALELDAVFADFSQGCKGKDLESPGVGEDGSIPAHELMEAAHLFYELIPRPQVKMVRVRQNHRRAHRCQVIGVERLYGGEGSDRHERGRWNVAVRRSVSARSC